MGLNKVKQQLSHSYQPSNRQTQRVVADANERQIQRLLKQSRAQAAAVEPDLTPEGAGATAFLMNSVSAYQQMAPSGRTARRAAAAGLTVAVAAYLLRRVGADAGVGLVPAMGPAAGMGEWATTAPFVPTTFNPANRLARFPVNGTTHSLSGSSQPTPANSSLVPAPLGNCFLNQAPTIQAQVGNQKFNAFFDTGSSDGALTMQGCACSDTLSAQYTPGPTAHDTGKPGGETYGVGLAGYFGEIYQDDVAVAGAPNTYRYQFVAATEENGIWEQAANCSAVDQRITSPANMILGFGPDAAAQNSRHSIPGFMAAVGLPNSFAVAMKTQGGAVTLGGYNPIMAEEEPEYVPLQVTQNSWYTINVADVLIDGQSTGGALGWENTIVDTGTPVMAMPDGAYAQTVAFLSPHVAPLLGQSFFDSNTQCVGLQPGITEAHLDAALPTMKVLLSGFNGATPGTGELPASQSYLAVLPTSTGGFQACNMLCPQEDAAGMPAFGAPIMRGSLLIFDGNRLGIAPASNFTATGGLPPANPVISLPSSSGKTKTIAIIAGASAGGVIGGILLTLLACKACKPTNASTLPV